MKRKFLPLLTISLAIALCFISLAPVKADLETPLLADVSATSGYAPYLQTNWYGFPPTAGKGYCAILSSTAGNSDLYLLDSNFVLAAKSKNTGLTTDKVWFGQSTAAPFHIAGFGNANPSSSYTIQIITAPYVKTINATSGNPGSLITLNGFGFGDIRGTNYVNFGTVTATNYYSWTNTQIKVYVPSNVVTGSTKIVVYVDSKASNPVNFTVSAFSSNGSMWRYDLARSGNYPGGPTTFPLNLKWKASYYRSDPVIADGIVYVAGYNNLSAIDANNGTTKWQFNGTAAFTTPAITNGTAYVGCNDGKVYALDATTGALKWSYFLGSGLGFYSSGPIVVSNGIVYAGASIVAVGNGQPGIYALDVNTGVLKWSYLTGNQLWSSPTIANNLVYITPEQLGKVLALDANTGVLKWSYATDAFNLTTPVIYNNILYVVGVKTVYYSYSKWRTVVFSLDANTGVLKWNYTGEEVDTTFFSVELTSSPAISGNTLYFGGLFTEVYALDLTTATLKWSFKTGGLPANQFAWSSPSFSNNVIYVASADKFYALDADTGKIKWTYVLSYITYNSSVAIFDSKVYIAPGELYCFGI